MLLLDVTRISHYEFGNIVIDGESYGSDVLILRDRVVRWQRRKSHMLHIEDLSEALEQGPDDLVIGTGYDGMMEVPSNLVGELRSRGISVDACRTREAVGAYNELVGKGRNVVAALHLTC